MSKYGGILKNCDRFRHYAFDVRGHSTSSRQVKIAYYVLYRGAGYFLEVIKEKNLLAANLTQTNIILLNLKKQDFFLDLQLM